jgi:tetratricopeptide repeat protein
MAQPATVGVEARPSMTVAASNVAGGWSLLVSPGRLASLMLALILAAIPGAPTQVNGGETSPVARPASAASGCVGSPACAQCHREIYNSYSRTDMGRSMSQVNYALLGKIPTLATIFDQRLNRHFETFVKDGNLYQSEYETEGQKTFRDTHKVDWIIGAGANGFGAIVRLENYLIEAPLSFYSEPNNWALSPGYEFADYGFSRPILPGCIECHSGQPEVIFDGNGRFRDPPFTELAIGCENCHGPGESHVAEMQISPEAGDGAIVNPAKLSSWLADNICMSCHQTGDARVPQAGKQYRDFRPGTALDDTFSIFLVPFGPGSTPKDDLLEHYLSMRLSKCYRNSDGKLGCIGCHDPHVQPGQQEAPAYFRQKCLACHAEKSCVVPLTVRQRKNPPDDCAGCHMPKRSVAVISHSVLTNHRIVAEADELFPDVAFHLNTPQLPDLVHLSAAPGRQGAPADLTLLQAYGRVMLSHPEYRQRYWALAKRLEGTQAENIFVLEALADWALQQKTREGAVAAIRYLDDAVKRGTTNPADFQQLGNLLIASGRVSEALSTFQKAIDLAPYDPEAYRALARSYSLLEKKAEACEVAGQAVQTFPLDAGIRRLSRDCESAKP